MKVVFISGLICFICISTPSLATTTLSHEDNEELLSQSDPQAVEVSDDESDEWESFLDEDDYDSKEECLAEANEAWEQCLEDAKRPTERVACNISHEKDVAAC